MERSLDLLLEAFLLAAILSATMSSAVREMLRVRTERRWELRHGADIVVSRLGGAGVFGGLVLTIVYLAWRGFPGRGLQALEGLNVRLLGWAAVTMFVVGICDDLFGIRPIVKLLGQALAAVCAVSGGLLIDTVSLPGIHAFRLPSLVATWTTLFWIVGVTNAYNLIDGIDGLASGVAVITISATAAIFLASGAPLLAFLALAAAGSTLGFFTQNVSRRRIFLGDGGAFLLGFAVAVFTLLAANRVTGTVNALALFLLCSLPIGDTALVMLRRFVSGRSVLSGDRTHLHHVLTARGLGSRGALATLLCWTLIAAISAVGMVVGSLLTGVVAGLTAALALLFCGVAIAPRRVVLVRDIVFDILGSSRISVAGWIRTRHTVTEIREATSAESLSAAVLRSVSEYGVISVEISSDQSLVTARHNRDHLSIHVPLKGRNPGIVACLDVHLSERSHGHLDDLHVALDTLLPSLELRADQLLNNRARFTTPRFTFLQRRSRSKALP